MVNNSIVVDDALQDFFPPSKLSNLFSAQNTGTWQFQSNTAGFSETLLLRRVYLSGWTGHRGCKLEE